VLAFTACTACTAMAIQQARRALVVYGSETGNAQDVAEELGRLAVRLRFDTEVAELDAITLVCRI
jgi:sulfite reductase alpha subunit-like flavoprotein